MELARRVSRLAALARRLQTEWSALRTPATSHQVLRVSLGIIYLWFGGLKLAHMSPVVDLVCRTYPFMGSLPLFLVLGLFEVALGGVLLLGVWKPWAAAAAIFHLVATFGVLVFAPHQSFAPFFPCLTMTGEFVAKNLVLLAVAIVLLLEAERVVPLESCRKEN